MQQRNAASAVAFGGRGGPAESSTDTGLKRKCRSWAFGLRVPTELVSVARCLMAWVSGVLHQDELGGERIMVAGKP